MAKTTSCEASFNTRKHYPLNNKKSSEKEDFLLRNEDLGSHSQFIKVMIQ